MSSIISVKNLSFRYQEETVLKNLSFEVKTGEFVGLIGENGSGKTTLLKLLLGFLTPQQGEIKLFGESVEKFKNWTEIGYIPQKVSQSTFDFPASVKEVILSNYLEPLVKKNSVKTATNLPFNLFKIFDRTKKSEMFEKVIEQTKIANLSNRLIGELSGGQRQRVFIARTLINNPKILLLDEPTVGVDQQNEENFYSLLENLNKRLGITIIFITHDLEALAKITGRILCINQGQLLHQHILNPAELELTLNSKLEHIHH